MSTKHIFTDFDKDINRYLNSKLVGVPPHEAQEISAYISNRVNILVVDMIRERDDGWLKRFDMMTREEAKRETYLEAVSKLRKDKEESAKEEN